MTLNYWQLKDWKPEGWSICSIALFSFVAGSLMTARWVHVTQVRADSSRVFEMRVYHTCRAKRRHWSHGFATRLQSYSPIMI